GVPVAAPSRRRSITSSEPRACSSRKVPPRRRAPGRSERSALPADRTAEGRQPSETEGQGTMSSLSTLVSAGLHRLGYQEVEGQGLVEYALILLLVCIACLA